MEQNTTKHRYLEAEFLKTALYSKTPEISSSLFYLDIQNRESINKEDIKVGFIEEKINCEKYFFPKEENILKENLVNMLFEEYIKLATSEKESILNDIKISKIKKWLFNNKSLIRSEKDLMAKIAIYSNVIAHNSRFGTANFIVIPPKLEIFFKKLKSFKQETEKDFSPIFLIGNINNIKVFVKPGMEDIILIGKDTKNINGNATMIAENSINFLENMIEWVGKIYSTENSKFKYEKLDFTLEEDMSYFKKLIYKIIKKLNLFKWIK